MTNLLECRVVKLILEATGDGLLHALVVPQQLENMLQMRVQHVRVAKVFVAQDQLLGQFLVIEKVVGLSIEKTRKTTKQTLFLEN